MSDPTTLYRPSLSSVAAYVAQRPTGMILLDAMETPESLAENIRAEIASLVRQLPLHRYPDANGRLLKEALRRYFAIPDALQLLLGNGSDEILQMLLMALNPGATIMSPEPGFVMYRHLAHCLGLRHVPLQLDENFGLPANTVAQIAEQQPDLLIFADPNNPTGVLYDQTRLAAALQAAPNLVLIDEAYQPYAGRDWLAAVGGRVLICRTLSKMGLAGLRLGVLLGEARWLAPLEKLRLPYNINAFTQMVVQHLLQTPGIFDAQTQRIISERQRVYQALAARPELHVWPSAANFLCLRIANATEVHRRLQAQGLLVKCLHGTHPLLRDCLRVTIGSSTENDRFLALLANM